MAVDGRRHGAGGARRRAGAPPLATEKDRLSYAMGMDLGQQLKTQSVEIDPALFARGLADALSGGRRCSPSRRPSAAIAELQKAMIVKRAEAARLAGEKNEAGGRGVPRRQRGEGGGRHSPERPPVQGSRRRARARSPRSRTRSSATTASRLVDGTEVDSSTKRGEPLTIAVKSAIKGWTEVLPLMPVGSKWEVFVPPSLGYGERGAGAQTSARTRPSSSSWSFSGSSEAQCPRPNVTPGTGWLAREADPPRSRRRPWV